MDGISRLRRRPPPRSTLFPYTTLFRSWDDREFGSYHPEGKRILDAFARGVNAYIAHAGDNLPVELDRKSTRLNSSHSQISYAVFCLKKKTRNYPCAIGCTGARPRAAQSAYGALSGRHPDAHDGWTVFLG